MFLTFWVANALRATAGCNFSTSELPKVVRSWCVLYILSCRCASRHSSVQFFHIWTSKSEPPLRCFAQFDLKTCFSLQRRAIFHVSSKQLPPHPPLYRAYFSTQPTHKSFKKTQHFATSLTFRACWSSFFWLSRNCIFFLLTLLLFCAFSSSDSATLLCFFNCPYCRKLDF